MNKNVGKTDKIIRIILAAILIILYATNVLAGTLGIVALVVSAVLLITAFINFCPLYGVCKINTKNNK